MAETIGSVYLTVKPELEGNPASLGKSFGNKFGSGAKASFGASAVALGNILSTGILGAANVLGSQFSEAFVGYMDFEQLFGGVQKIFDQADIAGIMEDANNAYKTLNMSANEYLASINQTGAAFAATMGDQAGYDTAKQGMQAIADYASGTGRNLDELNEKYALITRATSSYQSIADQFSGILPATSADFLAQAQAAGLLSEEYTKLTEVPIAEYQQAVSAMLEKGVDDMGLLGNTTAESTETISGSINMLKSAWSDFLVELGKDDADISGVVDKLEESLVAVAENVGPRLIEFATNAFAAFPEIAETLQPYIDDFMAQAQSFIEEHRPEIEAAAQQAFDGVKEGIKLAVEAAVQALGELLTELILTFPEWAPQVQQAGYDLILSIVEGLANGAAPFFDKVKETVQGGVDEVTGAVSDFVKGGEEIVTGIADGIGSGIGEITAKAGEIKDGIVSRLEEAAANVQSIPGRIAGFFQGIGSKVTAQFRSVTSGVKGVFDSVVRTVQSIPGRIVGFFTGLGSKISSAIGSIHMPTPHVSWQSISVGPASFSLPSVSWYGAGGFVNGAQLIGVGEKGAEMIWPEYSPYFDKYADALASRIGGGGITINLNYDASDDANTMLRDISSGIRQLRAAGAI